MNFYQNIDQNLIPKTFYFALVCDFSTLPSDLDKHHDVIKFICKIKDHKLQTISDMNNKPSESKKKVINVSADSFSGLSNELALLKQKYKSSASSSPAPPTANSVGPGKVYKRGVAKSLKGKKNKLDNVSFYYYYYYYSYHYFILGDRQCKMLTHVFQELGRLKSRTKSKTNEEELDRNNIDTNSRMSINENSDGNNQPVDERTPHGKRGLDHFHERAYTNLLAKTKLYEHIKAGKFDELDSAQRDNLLLDIEKDKMGDRWQQQQQDEEDLVEIEDDFGRTRLVPKSDIHYADHGDNYEDEGPVRRPRNLIRGNHIQADHFKLDEAAAQRLRQLAGNPEQAADSVATHFDPDWEIRTKGTGYYQFETADEKLRNSQMESLQAFRRETERVQTDKNGDGDDTSSTTPTSGSATAAERGDSDANTDSTSIIYKRKIHERKKYLEKLRNDKILHMKSFVKGSDL